MYIAAPPDEMDMLNRVKIEIMKQMPAVQIYLSTQVISQIKTQNLHFTRVLFYLAEKSQGMVSIIKLTVIEDQLVHPPPLPTTPSPS